MSESTGIVVNRENQWRLESPPARGWERGVRPDDRKYFMISCDTHLTAPPTLFRERASSRCNPDQQSIRLEG